MISRPNLPIHASSKYSRSHKNTRIGRGTASNQRKILALRQPLHYNKIRRALTWVAAVEVDHCSQARNKPDKEVVEVMVASVSAAEAESPTGLLLVAPGSLQERMDRVMQQASRALPSILQAIVASR